VPFSRRSYLYLSDLVEWLWHSNSAFTQGFQMGFDRFTYQSLGFLPAPANCDTSG
jgi:hypothetical protein